MEERDRLLVLEKDVAHIDKTLTEVKAEIKGGFEKADVKFDALNKRVDELKDSTNENFQEVNKKIFDSKDELKSLFKDELKKDLKWTIGVFGSGVLALAALMYFLFSRIPTSTVESKEVSAVSAPKAASLPGRAIPATKPVSATK